MSIRAKCWQLRYDLIRNRMLAHQRDSKTHGVILVYHHVTDEMIDEQESCVCTVNEFEKSFTDLLSQGYLFVSMEKGLELLRERSEQRFAVVTFDDVPHNFITNAYPILRQRQIPFTLFITTSYLQKNGYLNETEVKELGRDMLCTIGAHTMTHPMLRYSADMKNEICKPKLILEDLCQRPVELLAYPYGRVSAVSKKVRRLAKEAGYKYAFSTVYAPLTDDALRYRHFLPRVAYKGGNIESYFIPETPFNNKINKIKQMFGLK